MKKRDPIISDCDAPANDRDEDASREDRSGRFRRRIWRNWVLLAAVLALATMGLAVAIPPLLSGQFESSRPWAKADRLLLAGLSIMVLAFVAYLTQQQRLVLSMHDELCMLREESGKRLRQRTSRLFALSSLSRIISDETDLQSIFDRITGMCVETFSCYRASLMLHDNEANELVVRSVAGHSDAGIINLRQRVGDGIAGYAAHHRESIMLSGPSDFARYPGLEIKDPSLTSAMVVPIIVRDELVGVLNVSSRSGNVVYDENDLTALQGFASSAGACIRHAEQASWMRRMVPQLAGERRFERARDVL